MISDHETSKTSHVYHYPWSLISAFILPTHHMYLMLYIHVFFQGINQEMVDLKESNESENDTTVPNNPIKMMFLLLPFWQGQYNVSNNAVVALLKLRGICFSKRLSPSLSVLVNDFPTSLAASIYM